VSNLLTKVKKRTVYVVLCLQHDWLVLNSLTTLFTLQRLAFIGFSGMEERLNMLSRQGFGKWQS
jgi:hypothetical protein